MVLGGRLWTGVIFDKLGVEIKTEGARHVFGTLITVLALAVEILLLLTGINERRLGRESRSWPTVSGVISEAAVAAKKNKGYQVELEYTYEVKGVKYSYDRLRFGDPWFGRDEAIETAARYPEGTEVEIFYNPQNPAEAAIMPGESSYGVIVGVFIIFMVLLMGRPGLFWILKRN